MKISIHAIGRLKQGSETELCNRYQDRIGSQGRSVAIGPVTICELVESRAADANERKASEAAELLQRIPSDAHRVALDERGKTLTSVDFANVIKQIRDDGARELAFAVGGPDGHGDALKAAAHRTLSLGPMTFPHGLARVLLLEQIYRAITILTNHPYHRI
ncbi:MAG: 23S rRNA (pseudouridine(1915)-N(3))-methyltransferase RlmH [Hyphomicrobiaceae bacterium]